MAAIGLIETRGLVGVIEAADAAVKSAPVELLGIKPIGGGLVSTHFRGEVAAVQVAVQAGVEAARKVSQVISHRVICMLPMPFRLANLKGMREGRVVRHWVSRHASAYGTVRE